MGWLRINVQNLVSGKMKILLGAGLRIGKYPSSNYFNMWKTSLNQKQVTNIYTRMFRKNWLIQPWLTEGPGDDGWESHEHLMGDASGANGDWEPHAHLLGDSEMDGWPDKSPLTTMHSEIIMKGTVISNISLVWWFVKRSKVGILKVLLPMSGHVMPWRVRLALFGQTASWQNDSKQKYSSHMFGRYISVGCMCLFVSSM